MATRKQRRGPRYVIEDGMPTAVILDLDDYERILERLGERDDIQVLKRMRKKPLRFRALDEYLQQQNARF